MGNVPNRYSLAHITKELLGIELEKDTDIRCNFEQYKEANLSEIDKQFPSHDQVPFLYVKFSANAPKSWIWWDNMVDVLVLAISDRSLIKL